MAQDVVIRGVVYGDCPEVDIPLQGGGTAKFLDTSDATLASADQMLNGVTAYNGTNKITGNIPSKSSATYTPTTSDQTIPAGSYLSGVQTIEGDANLVAGNIIYGKSIFGVAGSVQVPVVTQDSTTKVLSIS